MFATILLSVTGGLQTRHLYDPSIAMAVYLRAFGVQAFRRSGVQAFRLDEHITGRWAGRPRA